MKKSQKFLLVTITVILISAVISVSAANTCIAQFALCEQSSRDLKRHKILIEQVTEKYGLSIEETSLENYENHTYYNFTIEINSDEHINILLENTDATGRGFGSEVFCLEYINKNPDVGNFAQIDLISDLVNAIAYKKFDKEFLKEFFNCNENKYPASDVGYEKLNGEKIAKQYNFDFWENETVWYILDSENCETITISGRLKK